MNVLIRPDEIQQRVSELGRRISRDYGEETDPLLLIGVLRGALLFLADLSRAISVPVEIDFMSVSSYEATENRDGVVRILKDLETDVSDRHILIVDGIVDTGLTLNHLLRCLQARNPRSLKVCTLLEKSVRRAIDIPIAYRGFKIPGDFVVGYGLDLDQRYRNLPFVGVPTLDDC